MERKSRFNFDEKTAKDPRINPHRPIGALALVKSTDAWVFEEPTPASARFTQMLFGEPLTVHEEKNDFYFVQSLYDEYCGWVHGSMLQQVPSFSKDSKWRAKYVAPVTQEADIKSPLLMYLPAGATLTIIGEQGDFYQLQKGWVHRQHIVEFQRQFDVVETAREQIGRSYIWGGRGLAGLDCSALAQFCYAFAGRILPRDADLQRIYLHLHHQKIKAKDLSSGDLIFVPGHVMIYSGENKVIHANGWHMRVVEEDFKTALSRLRKQLGDKFGISAYRWSQ